MPNKYTNCEHINIILCRCVSASPLIRYSFCGVATRCQSFAFPFFPGGAPTQRQRERSNMPEKTILTIKETVQRAAELGMPISEYTLRRAIRSGRIPCRIIGRKYLIAWQNVERYLTCADGCDNIPEIIRFEGVTT